MEYFEQHCLWGKEGASITILNNQSKSVVIRCSFILPSLFPSSPSSPLFHLTCFCIFNETPTCGAKLLFSHYDKKGLHINEMPLLLPPTFCVSPNAHA